VGLLGHRQRNSIKMGQHIINQFYIARSEDSYILFTPSHHCVIDLARAAGKRLPDMQTGPRTDSKPIAYARVFRSVGHRPGEGL
jgi:hypothetical protein